MTKTHTRGEMHGCIVCGKLYQLYVVYDSNDRFVDCKVMTPGGKRVPYPLRPLVACERHSQVEIERAVERAYGSPRDSSD